MDPLTRTILSEVTAFALISLAVALALFAYIRHRNPAVRWHAHGNVYSQPFNAFDMVVAGLFMSLFLSPLILAAPDDAGSGIDERAEPIVEQVAEDDGGEVEEVGLPPRTEELQPGQLERLINNALLQFFLIGSLLAYLTAGRGLHTSELFGLRQMSVLRAGIISLLVFIPVFFVIRLSAGLVESMLEKSLPEAPAQPLVETFVRTQSDLLRMAIALSAVIVAPLCEEILFRGFLYPVIKRHTERFFAAIFTGLIFAVIHYHVPSVVPLWVFGILLAISYEVTGSLWVPVCLHSLFNGYQTLKMFYPNSEIWWWLGSSTSLAG